MKLLLIAMLMTVFLPGLSQNVGIGTSTPTGPLSFSSAVGNKIVLWGDGNLSHYGLGIQSGQLQVYANQPADIISFGSGRSSAFSERMRIINTGGDGLQLLGRIYLKNGTSPLDPAYGAGTWLYKADNTALLGFMGVQNNQNIGFYGGPAGWGFVYDAVNSRAGIGTTLPSTLLNLKSPGNLTQPQLLIQQSNSSDFARMRLEVEPNAYWDVAGFTNSNVINDRLNFYNNRVGDILSLTGEGQVGIGNSNPNAPLAFPAILGKKITLYPGVSGDVGFGVQGNLFQIYSDYSGADIAFGYGTSNAFTETMRIKGNGNVGIGTINPQYMLDVSGRIRIRSGGNLSTSAGLWLNNANNSAVPAFIGMEDDLYVGFFGNGGAGWKFTMNVQSGALKINGSEGLSGQFLRSNGPGNAPSWTGSGNAFYQFNSTDYKVDLTAATPNANLAGIDGQTFTLSRTSAVLISGRILLLNIDNLLGGIGSPYLEVNLYDGSNNLIARDASGERIGNGEISNLYIQFLADNLPPGTYTLNALVRKGTGDDLGTGWYYTGWFNTTNGNVIVQVFPK